MSGINKRPLKGKSLVELPTNYVAIDLETTGFSPKYDKIIEIGAVRFTEGKQSETFQQLVNPGVNIDDGIVKLTGITNEMLVDGIDEKEAINKLLSFIEEDDILVGHNIAAFDSNFLYDATCKLLNKPITNDFVDTYRLAKKLHPEWDDHRLKSIRTHYGISRNEEHRALSDAVATAEILECFREEAFERFTDLDDFQSFMTKKKNGTSNRGSLESKHARFKVQEYDESHPFYDKEIAVTGKMDYGWTQADVKQAVEAYGGTYVDKFKKKSTDILIVGDYSRCRLLEGKPSKNHQIALEKQAEGKDVLILSPDVFFDLVGAQMDD